MKAVPVLYVATLTYEDEKAARICLTRPMESESELTKFRTALLDDLNALGLRLFPLEGKTCLQRPSCDHYENAIYAKLLALANATEGSELHASLRARSLPGTRIAPTFKKENPAEPEHIQLKSSVLKKLVSVCSDCENCAPPTKQPHTMLRAPAVNGAGLRLRESDSTSVEIQELALQARIARLEADLIVERCKRVECEQALEDIRRECKQPFLVPLLLDTFLSIPNSSS
ncbi:hypothetical protein BDZ89DRAFT_1072713 [Hymenopellis radicata]|nr:hypothetical protein BDZ89DRAFT_1072713 [Hymenopellis radicata]